MTIALNKMPLNERLGANHKTKDPHLSAPADGVQSEGELQPTLQCIFIGMLKGFASIDINQRGLLIAQTFSANRETLSEFRGQGIVAQER